MPYESSPPVQVQQLAYLREVAAAGSLTEAARRIGISQPALSQSLSELERRLGVPLFERAGRARVLTEAGREVVHSASEVLERLDALYDRVEASRRGDSGQLRVGMIDAASLYLLPQAIRGFHESHPQVELRLVVDQSEELLRRLRAFEIDVAFVVGPPEPGLTAREIVEEPLYLYAPAGAARSDVPQSPASEWALYPAGSRTRQLIEEALLREGLRPRVTLESSNPEVLRQAVTLGLAWSVLPSAVAEVHEPRLVRARRRPLVTRTLLAVRRASSPPDPRVEALLALASTPPA